MSTFIIYICNFNCINRIETSNCLIFLKQCEKLI
uniref:Uncharacterized protein n=1 Tax=Brugia timori TaxID=42155 RepID=A0A0R3QFU1_9BILA